MSALIIGEVQRNEIKELVSFARLNILDPSGMQSAADADIDAYRNMMDSHSVSLPVGYFVTYSHEHQPFGLARHISISVRHHGKMPAPVAVEMILQEFGMMPLSAAVGVWIEDIEDGRKAINIVQPA